MYTLKYVKVILQEVRQLDRQHFQRKRIVQEINKKHKVSKITLYRWMHEFHIPMRDYNIPTH